MANIGSIVGSSGSGGGSAINLGDDTLLYANFLTMADGAVSEVTPQWNPQEITLTPINLQKTSNGISPATTSGGYLVLGNMPAFSGDFRRYSYTVSADESGPQNAILDFMINFVSATECLQAYRILDATGSWVNLMYSWAGGVSTERARNTIDVNIENAIFSVVVEDHGDTVLVATNASEPSTGLAGAYVMRYNTASRILQDILPVRFQWFTHSAGDQIRVQKLVIEDVTY